MAGPFTRRGDRIGARRRGVRFIHCGGLLTGGLLAAPGDDQGTAEQDKGTLHGRSPLEHAHREQWQSIRFTLPKVRSPPILTSIGADQGPCCSRLLRTMASMARSS